MTLYAMMIMISTGDNKQQNANQCLLKIANLSSAADDFSKAGEIFESLGN
jgi:hypothetical protein